MLPRTHTISRDIWEFTLVKNYTNAISVTLHLFGPMSWECIWKFTHKCNRCEFASVRAESLRQHMKTHTGEKSYRCNQCDYACVDSGNFRRHSRVHLGEKAHNCNQCDYASVQASTLRRHLKTHTGEKPFKCNQCEYASVEETYDNTLGRKITQMQSVWLCNWLERCFEDTYENTRRWKVI